VFPESPECGGTEVGSEEEPSENTQTIEPWFQQACDIRGEEINYQIPFEACFAYQHYYYSCLDSQWQTPECAWDIEEAESESPPSWYMQECLSHEGNDPDSCAFYWTFYQYCSSEPYKIECGGTGEQETIDIDPWMADVCSEFEQSEEDCAMWQGYFYHCSNNDWTPEECSFEIDPEEAPAPEEAEARYVDLCLTYDNVDEDTCYHFYDFYNHCTQWTWRVECGGSGDDPDAPVEEEEEIGELVVDEEPVEIEEE